ncbi:MAG TPA: hypothetical protein VGV89_10465 [Thermoplasmata archaeon]|nr:hypothetical protein [Thermoplasmata archaeon]
MNVHVQIPEVLAKRIEEQIRKRGSATSIADFLRQAGMDRIDRIEREERGDSPPVDLAGLGDPIKAVRRR